MAWNHSFQRSFAPFLLLLLAFLYLSYVCLSNLTALALIAIIINMMNDTIPSPSSSGCMDYYCSSCSYPLTNAANLVSPCPGISLLFSSSYVHQITCPPCSLWIFINRYICRHACSYFPVTLHVEDINAFLPDRSYGSSSFSCFFQSSYHLPNLCCNVNSYLHFKA